MESGLPQVYKNPKKAECMYRPVVYSFWTDPGKATANLGIPNRYHHQEADG